MENTRFATIKDVRAAISSLGLEMTKDALGAVSRICRPLFLKTLEKCSAPNGADEASLNFLGALTRCLSPNTVRQIEAIHPNATIDLVAKAAAAAPNRLLTALNAASNVNHARHDDAKSYLASLFPAKHFPKEPSKNTDTLPAEGNAAEKSCRKGRFRQSVHVYGASYALCFNADHKEGEQGVMVDAAVQSGAKSYDWANATHIWLNINEAGAILAVLRRWRRSIELTNHGAQNDKSFLIELQGNHFFAKVTAKKTPSHPARAVKILPTDASAVAILFLMQISRNYPTIPLAQILDTVRATHSISDAKAA
ncbi:MAG: hypothetical protein LBU76_09325 [Azoarcus sp.]|jgi:hypothetical protein|nr:hypothetical protein [Azoarcus sp.]